MPRQQQFFHAFFGGLRIHVVLHFHGNTVDVLAAADLVHQRGVGHINIHATGIAKRIVFFFQRADNGERPLVHHDDFAQRVAAVGE